ncbi:MAG: hydroxyacylglutathione hydrolase [Myxococcales bacterium]|nr:hydroxyacylglutathione hydrolase [Myxococcales bacterium]
MPSHVVTQPRAPFVTSSGRLSVHQLPAAHDNLVWLLVVPDTREAAVVDGPDARAALAYCESHGLRLTTVLNTHTHHDHIGVNLDLRRRGLLAGMRVVGPKRVATDVPGISQPVEDGDVVRFGAVNGRVLLTEGHINGHVSYVFDDVLLCGDTLFAGGCGYLFDGPPAKMHASLTRLAALAGDTWVCCAHEYTQDNLRFAWSVDADNAALAQRIRDVWRIRAEGGCAVPSTIAEERATNPFLRSADPGLRRRVGEAMPDYRLDDDVSVFAATRALKDRKLYRSMGDDVLPLNDAV